MNSLPHYYHHDPTIINAHRLLKPQAYQHSSSVTPNVIPATFLSCATPQLYPHHPTPDPWRYSHTPFPPHQPTNNPSIASNVIFHSSQQYQHEAEKDIFMFDGGKDAYWWVLCNDRYFTTSGTPEAEKLMKAVATLRGCAHQWWICWYHLHPKADWEMFVVAFLWRFEREHREVLPLPCESETTEVDNDSIKMILEDKIDQEPNPHDDFDSTIDHNSNSFKVMVYDATSYSSNFSTKICKQPIHFFSVVLSTFTMNMTNIAIVNPPAPNLICSSHSDLETLVLAPTVSIPKKTIVKNVWTSPPQFFGHIFDPGGSNFFTQKWSLGFHNTQPMTFMLNVVGFCCGGESEFKRYNSNLFSTFAHKLFVKIPLTPTYVNTTLLQELNTVLTLHHSSSLFESLHCNITYLTIAWSLLGPCFTKSFNPFILDIQLVFPYDQFPFSSITKFWHEKKLGITPNRKVYMNLLITSCEEILLDLIKCDNPWYFILLAKFADKMLIGESLAWNDTPNLYLVLVLKNKYEFSHQSQYVVESFAGKLVFFYMDFGFDINVNGGSTDTAFKYPSVTPRECYVTLLVNEIMLLAFMYFIGKINHPSKSLVIVFSLLASTVLEEASCVQFCCENQSV